MKPTPSTPFRLLALDADGTILDADGSLRPRVRDAVKAARSGGVTVVLCTGRRYRTARRILEELELDGPAVVQNGVRVVNGSSGETLSGRYLPDDLYRPVLEVMRRFGPPLVYVDSPSQEVDIVTEDRNGGHRFQSDYVAHNIDVIRVVDSLDRPPPEPVIMMSRMANAAPLERLASTATRELGDRITTHHIHNKMYEGHILEILSAEANKWNALEELARSLGIASEEIFAIGDDQNDRRMLEEAGFGVAMANAKPEVRAIADFVTGPNVDDGAAHAIERFILGR